VLEGESRRERGEVTREVDEKFVATKWAKGYSCRAKFSEIPGV
jgi:hypothetical protein